MTVTHNESNHEPTLRVTKRNIEWFSGNHSISNPETTHPRNEKPVNVLHKLNHDPCLVYEAFEIKTDVACLQLKVVVNEREDVTSVAVGRVSIQGRKQQKGSRTSG